MRTGLFPRGVRIIRGQTESFCPATIADLGKSWRVIEIQAGMSIDGGCLARKAMKQKNFGVSLAMYVEDVGSRI